MCVRPGVCVYLCIGVRMRDLCMREYMHHHFVFVHLYANATL